MFPKVLILIKQVSDYCCIASLISKNGVINLMQNADLTKESRTFSIKNMETFQSRYKKPITKFGSLEIEKQKFRLYKKPIPRKNININKIVVSNKVSFG